MNTSYNLPNFCTTVRDAITTGGWSYVKALGVINSALGMAKLTKENETTLGKVGYKEYKKKEDKATFSVKLGSLRYEALASKVGKGNMTAIMFAAWNETVIAMEKLNPSCGLRIEPQSEFGIWLSKVASADRQPEPVHETVTENGAHLNNQPAS